ncbi:VRR-NUC domain-containing protein [bacterium]|nr:VRR-NUC domain-containing protein [bacterium]
MKNPKRIKGAKQAWEKYGDEWFEDEMKFKAQLEENGYEILAHRGGYPDFMYKVDNEIRFAEIKKGNNPLTNQQKKVLTILQKAGFRVSVLRYKNGKFDEDTSWME